MKSVLLIEIDVSWLIQGRRVRRRRPRPLSYGRDPNSSSVSQMHRFLGGHTQTAAEGGYRP